MSLYFSSLSHTATHIVVSHSLVCLAYSVIFDPDWVLLDGLLVLLQLCQLVHLQHNQLDFSVFVCVSLHKTTD